MKRANGSGTVLVLDISLQHASDLFHHLSGAFGNGRSERWVVSCVRFVTCGTSITGGVVLTHSFFFPFRLLERSLFL